MPSASGYRTPGFRFKDGKLMIFREHEVMIIQGWDTPSALRKDCLAWESFIPEFRLVAPYRRSPKSATKNKEKPSSNTAPGGQLAFDLWDATVVEKPAASKPTAPKPQPIAEQRKRAFDAFRFSLPKEVAKALEKFRSHQWHLLFLLSQDKQILDLAIANPVLTYAVADWYADHPHSQRNLGRMPQRDLLALLKLPDTAATVKLFRKIPPESIDPRLWKFLLTVLRQPDGICSKWLAHVPSINLGVMEMILTPQIHTAVTPTLLEEVAASPQEKYRGGVAAMLRDTEAMKHELTDDRPLTGFSTIASVRDLHGKVSAEFQKLEDLRKAHGALPLPPIPGIKGRIMPLSTQAELIAEGRKQHNCVASYIGSVKGGKCYIYRVLYPSRATLSISRQSGGNWGISELKFSSNSPADQVTRDFVEQWLDGYRVGL